MFISLFSLTVVNWPNVSKQFGGNPKGIDSNPLAIRDYLPSVILDRHLWVGILVQEAPEHVLPLLMEHGFTVAIIPDKGYVVSASLHSWEREVVALSRLPQGREFANRVYNGFRRMKMDLWINYRRNIVGKEVEFATTN